MHVISARDFFKYSQLRMTKSDFHVSLIINLIKKALRLIDSHSFLRYNIYLVKHFETIKRKFVPLTRMIFDKNFASNKIRVVANGIDELIMIGKRQHFAFKLINFGKYMITSQLDKEETKKEKEERRRGRERERENT